MTYNAGATKSGPYTANGSQTVFGYGFKIYASTDIEVIETSVAGVESTVNPSNYTLSGIGNDAGGNITFSVAPSNGKKITARLKPPVEQQTNLRNQGGYLPEVVERMGDRLAMISLYIAEELSRSIKVDISSGVSPTNYLQAVQSSAAAAATSETNAAASASAASTSASSAATSATSASTSATNAGNSATAAASSASSASTSASTATTQATNASNSATAADAASRLTLNSQSADYTLVIGDANKIVQLTGSTGRTFTIPPNSSVAFALGTQIAFQQDGSGVLTLAPGSGVTIKSENSWLKLAAQYAMATVVKVGTNEWLLSGSLKP